MIGIFSPVFVGDTVTCDVCISVLTDWLVCLLMGYGIAMN
jgi:hypothetical protein